MNRVENFTLHNDRGMSILDRDLLHWREFFADDKSGHFGPITRYSWNVNGVECEKWNWSKNFSFNELPDASGFIGFERGWRPDNCVLFDSYGNERMRLTVPWQLTRQQNPESAKSPTSFVGVGAPAKAPHGKQGEFGVEAWVEYAGMYYFELDYHSGQFLWGKEIRD